MWPLWFPCGKSALPLTKVTPNAALLKGEQNTNGKKGGVEWSTAKPNNVFISAMFLYLSLFNIEPCTKYWEMLEQE